MYRPFACSCYVFLAVFLFGCDSGQSGGNSQVRDSSDTSDTTRNAGSEAKSIQALSNGSQPANGDSETDAASGTTQGSNRPQQGVNQRNGETSTSNISQAAATGQTGKPGPNSAGDTTGRPSGNSNPVGSRPAKPGIKPPIEVKVKGL